MSRWLDRAAARRWFERAPAGLGENPIAREVERRMATRLEFVKLDPQRILVVGCGTAAGRAALRARYPKAEMVVTDAAYAAVRGAYRAQPLAARVRSAVGAARERFLCADMAALPLRTASCGMVWSNLALAWSPEPAATLAEWHRALEVGGLLMFSSYGPDTLKELRGAFAKADAAPHVHPFVDMHDLGDALVAGGFADPVMDMDMLTVTYERVDGLVSDLRASGQRNAHAGRRRGLMGRGAWLRMADAYAGFGRAGRVPATFEIVHGHGWKAAPRTTADGRPIIRVDFPRRSGKTD